MSDISTWSTTAASNNSASPDGFPENMAPSGVNDSNREVMAANRRQWEDAQWFDFGHTVTYASATTFTIATDLTATYAIGRRIRCVDATTLYGRISVVSYSAPNTTVTVVLDTGSLSGSLASVAVGILTAENHSIPQLIYPRINESVAVTASSTEINLLTGLPTTATELGYVSGVTSAIQTQINNTSGKRGALVYNAANQNVATATYTALAFDSETYDTSSIHDTVTNNSRLTVPSGVSKVRLSGIIEIQGVISGARGLYIYKNGVRFAGGPTNVLWVPSTIGTDVLAVSSAIVSVTPGDYFTLVVYQVSGSTLSVVTGLSASGDSTWFSMEIVE